MDIYYSIRIIYCNIPLLIKLILGGFNHEAKKYVKKGNVAVAYAAVFYEAAAFVSVLAAGLVAVGVLAFGPSCA